MYKIISIGYSALTFKLLIEVCTYIYLFWIFETISNFQQVIIHIIVCFLKEKNEIINLSKIISK